MTRFLHHRTSITLNRVDSRSVGVTRDRFDPVTGKKDADQTGKNQLLLRFVTLFWGVVDEAVES